MTGTALLTWSRDVDLDFSLGQANLIDCFSSLPASLFTPPPLISLLLLSVTARILMLRSLDIHGK